MPPAAPPVEGAVFAGIIVAAMARMGLLAVPVARLIFPPVSVPAACMLFRSMPVACVLHSSMAATVFHHARASAVHAVSVPFSMVMAAVTMALFPEGVFKGNNELDQQAAQLLPFLLGQGGKDGPGAFLLPVRVAFHFRSGPFGGADQEVPPVLLVFFPGNQAVAFQLPQQFA